MTQTSTSPASVSARFQSSQGTCVLSYDPLDVNLIIKSVGDDSAGATAVFIGTTRDSFKGKAVTRLEYQAYSKLAIKTMANIMAATQDTPSSRETSLIRCAIHHRLGTVPVGDPSIVIAVSSPHRKEAFYACEMILEQVKLKAQIWKREFYEGEREEEAEWKKNN